jgi:hypothetical protein
VEDGRLRVIQLLAPRLWLHEQSFFAIFGPQTTERGEELAVDPASVPAPQLFQQSNRERMIDSSQESTDLLWIDGGLGIQMIAEFGGVTQALALSKIVPEQVEDNQIVGPPTRCNDGRGANGRPRLAG